MYQDLPYSQNPLIFYLENFIGRLYLYNKFVKKKIIFNKKFIKVFFYLELKGTQGDLILCSIGMMRWIYNGKTRLNRYCWWDLSQHGKIVRGNRYINIYSISNLASSKIFKLRDRTDY